MNNKGEVGLGDISGVTLSFLLTGVFFAIGIVILAAFQTNTYTSTFQYNETFTMPNATGISFTVANQRLVSVQNIYNVSTGVSIPAANYSVVSSNPSLAGTINWTGGNNTICAIGNGNTGCAINYTYLSNTTTAPVSVGKTITAMSEIPNNWLLLIAVVLAAAIVIGIVVKNLGGMSNNRS